MKTLKYPRGKVIGSALLVCLLFSSDLLAATRFLFQDLGGLDGTHKWTADISEVDASLSMGRVVGGVLNDLASPHIQGFVWEDGVTSPLPPIAAGAGSTASAVNGAGQVAGSSDGMAVVWTHGVASVLPALGNDYAHQANAINDQGLAVGQATALSNLVPQPVKWDDSGIHQLELAAGMVGGAAMAVNDAAVIAGYRTDVDGRAHATVWQNGSALDLGTLGGIESRAQDINNGGVLAGFALFSDGSRHAFMGDVSGGLQDLGPGRAWAINDHGQIVGDLSTSKGQHAAFWDGSMVYDLNDLVDVMPAGWLLSTATGINTAGQIAVIGITDHGHLRAGVLSPVPLPPSIILMVSALSLVGLAGLRCQRTRLLAR